MSRSANCARLHPRCARVARAGVDGHDPGQLLEIKVVLVAILVHARNLVAGLYGDIQGFGEALDVAQVHVQGPVPSEVFSSLRWGGWAV